jgi:hypothetical protein
MPVIDQALSRKYLLRGNNIVVPRSEQKYWSVQLGESDPPAQRGKISCGQAIFLEYLFNDLQVIAARQIHRPRVPVAEARLQPSKCRRPDRIRWPQQTMDFIAPHIRSPKPQQAIAEDTPMPELDDLLENWGWSIVGEIGQLRLARSNI